MAVRDERMMGRLAKEALEETRLSHWPSLLEVIQLVKDDLQPRQYSVFEFKPHHHFHLSTTKTANGICFYISGILRHM